MFFSSEIRGDTIDLRHDGFNFNRFRKRPQEWPHISGNLLCLFFQVHLLVLEKHTYQYIFTFLTWASRSLTMAHVDCNLYDASPVLCGRKEAPWEASASFVMDHGSWDPKKTLQPPDDISIYQHLYSSLFMEKWGLNAASVWLLVDVYTKFVLVPLKVKNILPT